MFFCCRPTVTLTLTLMSHGLIGTFKKTAGVFVHYPDVNCPCGFLEIPTWIFWFDSKYERGRLALLAWSWLAYFC